MTTYDFSGDTGRGYGYVTARVLLAAVFLFTGYAKLADTQDAAADIAEIGLPLPVLLAVIAGVVELVCGILLVLGKQPLWAAVYCSSSCRLRYWWRIRFVHNWNPACPSISSRISRSWVAC